MQTRFIRSLLLAIGIMIPVASSAAEDIKIGCYPKPRLLEMIQARQQKLLDQYMETFPEGERKITVTGEYHDGKGFVHPGRGYLIKADDNTACVIGRLRIDAGPEKGQITAGTLHRFLNFELTWDEWKKAAAHTNKDKHAQISKWQEKGYTLEEINNALRLIEIMSKGGNSGGVTAKFVYSVDKGGNIHPLVRTKFRLTGSD